MDVYHLVCAFVTGALLCLAMLLLFLRVPRASEWHSFRKAKRYTALASFLLFTAYGSSSLMGWTASVSTLLVWFVVASLQAILFSFTCVVFVAPQTRVRRLIFWNLIPVAVLTLLMIGAYLFTSHWSKVLLGAGVVCYLGQLVFYTHYFITVYRSNIKHLEEVYADDLASRLAWVKRLFFSALVVGLLAVAVILLANQTIDAAFGLVVASYYSFVANSFVNYVSRASFVVKAATLTMEPEAEETTADEVPTSADSLASIRKAVEDWVAAKHYLEPDVSVEEISQQMGITRQALNDYFSTVLQTPFRSWRIELRIDEARRLLAADPSIATGELCARCGYNDRSNFHKHFAKVTGQSLAEYREKLIVDS
ncbi:MAG: helix-turn-helix transcriptional regulator [Bacteroidaceae bacterium]|nr:helix-turn-helix transcriptional regulator [Bacteroidaceae bacterium]